MYEYQKEEKNMKERLMMLVNTKIIVETKGHHVGYLVHKGVLLNVGDDFIELDCGNKGVIIPISEIRVVTIR